MVPPSAAIKGGNEKDKNKTHHQFLKKANGIASLTLELFWFPKAEAKDLGGGTAESSGDPAPVTNEVTPIMVFYPRGKLEITLSSEERRRVNGLAIGEAGEVERVIEVQDRSGVERTHADVPGEQETVVKDSMINPRHLTMEEHQLGLPASSPSSPSPIPVPPWNTRSAPQAFVLTPDPTGTFSPVYHPELCSRAETGFGIPYHLLDSLNGIQPRQDCHHDWSCPAEDFEQPRFVAAAEGFEGVDQYGNGFRDQDGSDNHLDYLLETSDTIHISLAFLPILLTVYTTSATTGQRPDNPGFPYTSNRHSTTPGSPPSSPDSPSSPSPSSTPSSLLFSS
ncbi:hypothetical protein EV360DRAFT_88818 [Lentinula raphanica]|nr:hypothetical protein EV360DRAFT_88818 [Lentinula raphanica]